MSKEVIIFGIFLFLQLFFPRMAFAQVVINEFLVDGSPEWVEFYNASSSAEYLKAYWIDDDLEFDEDGGALGRNKKLLSELNTTDITYPFIELNEFLNDSSDYVVLFDQDGNIVDRYPDTYIGPGENIAIGRYPDRTGNFSILSSSTKGAPNSASFTPSPTPTPSPIPTFTPTPTPTPTLTPIPTKTPTSIPTPTFPVEELSLSQLPTSTSVPDKGEEIVLGAKNEDKKVNKFPPIAAFMVISGMGVIISSLVLFAKKKKEV